MQHTAGSHGATIDSACWILRGLPGLLYIAGQFYVAPVSRDARVYVAFVRRDGSSDYFPCRGSI
jgi:hypothetical protein